MTTDDGIVYDRSLLGVENHIGTFQLTREMILSFAKSTGETNSRYVGDENGEGEIVNLFINEEFVGGYLPLDKLESILK